MILNVPRPFRIGLFTLACVVVLWLSLTPVQALPSVDLWDKAQHALAYFVLALLGAWAFPALMPLAVALVLLGVGIEVLQGTMGLGRQGDPLDGLANTLGVLAGTGLALLGRRR